MRGRSRRLTVLGVGLAAFLAFGGGCGGSGKNVTEGADAVSLSQADGTGTQADGAEPQAAEGEDWSALSPVGSMELDYAEQFSVDYYVPW